MQIHLRQYLCTLYQSCTAASKTELSQNLVDYLYFFHKETDIVELNIHARDHEE